MKVTYFHIFRGDAESGVNKKVLSQVRALKELDIPTTLLLVAEEGIPVPHDPNISVLRYPKNKEIFHCRAFDILYREKMVHTYLQQLIASLSHDDIVYMRIPYPTPFSIKSLSIDRKCKIVIEYQTIEPIEYRKKGMYGYLILDILFGTALRKYSDAIVGVTDEITRYQLTRSRNLAKPHITIGNGFDVSSVPIRTPPPFDGKDFHIICVADVSIWHGYDRLLYGLKKYDGPVKINVHIVGEGKDIPRLQRIVSELGLSEYVTFHGFLSGKDLDHLFNKCHVAVGSLGMHRLGLYEASTLKVREYCARGIPFVIGHDDPDFSCNVPFVLKCPADETHVDLNSILFFVALNHGTQHFEKMRQFATENLGWVVKITELKVFFKTLVNNE